FSQVGIQEIDSGVVRAHLGDLRWGRGRGRRLFLCGAQIDVAPGNRNQAGEEPPFSSIVFGEAQRKQRQYVLARNEQPGILIICGRDRLPLTTSWRHNESMFGAAAEIATRASLLEVRVDQAADDESGPLF